MPSFSPEFWNNMGYLVAGVLITGIWTLLRGIASSMLQKTRRAYLQWRIGRMLKTYFYKNKPELLKKRRAFMAEEMSYYLLRQSDKGKVRSYREIILLLEALDGGKIAFRQDGEGRAGCLTLRKDVPPPKNFHRKLSWHYINDLLCLEGSWAFFYHTYSTGMAAFQYIFSPYNEKGLVKLSKEEAAAAFHFLSQKFDTEDEAISTQHKTESTES